MKKKHFLLLIIFLSTVKIYAQEGHFINFWGAGQQSWLLNRDDYNGITSKAVGTTDRLLLEETYRSAYGIDYYYNFDTSFGIQTGLIFSRQGQKYSGLASRTLDSGKTTEFFNFRSQVLMDYFKLPVMFRFNSPIDEDERMNMSLYAGFYAGYLWRVTDVSSNPPQDSVNTPAPDFKKFYETLDFGFTGGAQMNIRITKIFAVNFGLRYDRGFVNIEKQRTAMGANYPAEWYFPLSTKKSVVPSSSDALTRLPTRNTTVNLFIGLAFKLR